MNASELACDRLKRRIHAVVYRVIASISQSPFPPLFCYPLFFYDLCDRFLIGLSNFSYVRSREQYPVQLSDESDKRFDQPSVKRSVSIETSRIIVNHGSPRPRSRSSTVNR